MTDKTVYRCQICNLFQHYHDKCVKCETEGNLIEVDTNQILAVIANKLTSIDKKLRED